MEELAGGMWSYPESNEDLKHKLLCTTMELESVKKEASQANEQSRERERQLHDLLKIAYKERDGARDQLQKVLNKLVPSNPPLIPAVQPQLHSDSILLLPATKANSSITAESNSFTETYNTSHSTKSYSSSPSNSNFFESVSSPEFSNFNMNDSNNVSNNENMTVNNYNLLSCSTTKIDHASVLIDGIAKGKPLPQKGRLLEAVLQSGPLLHTLLVAGPLPRWRNPPPVQPFKMPTNSSQSIAALRKRPLTLTTPLVDISCGSSQLVSTSVLNFGGASSGSSCYANRQLLASPGFNFSNQIAVGKRQRLL